MEKVVLMSGNYRGRSVQCKGAFPTQLPLETGMCRDFCGAKRSRILMVFSNMNILTLYLVL